MRGARVRRDGRELALDVLCAIEESGAYANLALTSALRGSPLSAVDRGLTTELVYGVERRRLTLDWLLAGFVNRPLAKLTPWVLNLLRLSVYQFQYLDRIPVEAACDQAVEIAKRRGNPGIGGFVNGVLRAFLRGRAKLPWPGPEPDPVFHLAVRESHPEWLVERWLARLGFDETSALLAADNLLPPLTLRANRLRTTPEELQQRLTAAGIATEASHLVPEGLRLHSREGAVEGLDEVKRGFAQVQDEASMLIAHLVAPQPGETVLDAAAAPGGKATHLAELMGDRGEVLACDVHPGKLNLIRENAERLGLSAVRAEARDALSYREDPAFHGRFDRVLLDAPCSGLGVLRRRPDARWRKTPEDIAALAAQQRLLLASVATAVKPGGRLVYSTCSTEEDEGELVAEGFLADHSGEFEVLSACQTLDREGIQAADAAVFRGPYLRLWPHRHGTDGFFAACFIRRSS